MRERERRGDKEWEKEREQVQEKSERHGDKRRERVGGGVGERERVMEIKGKKE